MRRRKAIPEWAVVDESGEWWSMSSKAECVAYARKNSGWRAAKVVEHEPEAEAVVRAAIKAELGMSPMFELRPEDAMRLIRAVDALLESRAGSLK